MRIACPNCQTLYDVPDNLLGESVRRLRCEQCGHGWAFAPAPSPEAPPDAAPTPDMPASEAATRRFGQPADPEAAAEMQAALRQEASAPHAAAAAVPPARHTEPDTSKAEIPEGDADRFASLVRAARSQDVDQDEPPAARQAKQAASPLLIVLLVLLLVIALAVAERHLLIRLIPASARLFQALHLR